MNKPEKNYKETLTKIKSGVRVPILKVLRLKCLDCCGWQENEVKACEADDCILHPFRMGKNPIKRKMSEKQKVANKENIKKLLKHKKSTST